MKYVAFIFAILCLVSCASHKVLMKKCHDAQFEELFICDKY